MEFYEEYIHVGYSYPGVPNAWVPIVENAIRDIERAMWPRWLPRPICRAIHWLGTGNSIVRVKYRWAFNLRQHLTRGQMVTDIKEKFATLRIYGSFHSEIHEIIRLAETACSKTCQHCGSTGEDVKRINAGWVYNLCATCTSKM